MPNSVGFSETEDRFQSAVRDAVLAAIRHRGWGESDLVRNLGFLPSGAFVVLNSRRWPIDVTLRLADYFNVDVKVQVPEAGTRSDDAR